MFDKCTETIIRQVGDVARMVDEFSSFARMPKPQFANEDLRARRPRFRDTVPDGSAGNIRFKMDLPADPVMMWIDRRLISQAITNLVKNGAEAVQGLIESDKVPTDFEGRVETELDAARMAAAVIEVIDNGVGLSKQMRARLLEPYVTTKAKGTGLGLAIVQKIIEQHGGRLELTDAPHDRYPHQRRARARAPAAFAPPRRRATATIPRRLINRRLRRRPTEPTPTTSGPTVKERSERWHRTFLSLTTRRTSASWLQAFSKTKGTSAASPATATRRCWQSRRASLISSFSISGCRAAASTGSKSCSIIRKVHPELPVIIISGHGNIETAVTAIKRGAYDYIEKPFQADRLLLVTLRALEASQLRREIQHLRERSTQACRNDRRQQPPSTSSDADRARRANQQPHPDSGPVGRRQGTRGAYAARKVPSP